MTDTREPLSNDEMEGFAGLLLQIVQLSTLIPTETARQAVRQMDGFDTIMPIMDPTRWMREHKDARRALDMARAFLAFRQAMDKIKEEATI